MRWAATARLRPAFTDRLKEEGPARGGAKYLGQQCQCVARAGCEVQFSSRGIAANIAMVNAPRLRLWPMSTAACLRSGGTLAESSLSGIAPVGTHQHLEAGNRAVHPLRFMVSAISSARSGVRG